MSVLVEPSLVPLSIYRVQPVASVVVNFWERFEGKMPHLKELRFLADALVIPNEHDKTILTIALTIEGFRHVEGENYQRFFAICSNMDFIYLNPQIERIEFPRLLDVEIEPFDDALSLAISVTRGHLLPRFHGSIWPNFILPAISVNGLCKSMKLRDKLLAEENKGTTPKQVPEQAKDAEATIPQHLSPDTQEQ